VLLTSPERARLRWLSELFASLVAVLLVVLVAAETSSQEFGFFLLALMIFFVAAIAAFSFYALLTQQEHPLFVWLRGYPVAATSIMFAFLPVVLFVALFSTEPHFWNIGIFLLVRRVTSAPETVQFLLGGLFGVMWHSRRQLIAIGTPAAEDKKFETQNQMMWDARHQLIATNTPGSIDQQPGTSDQMGKWPLLLFAGGLSIVVLAALIAPQGPALLGRLAGVETPLFKIQVATSTTERQLVLNIERSIGGFDGLDNLVRGSRFTEFECGYQALRAQGLGPFKTPENFPKYERYRLARWFRENVVAPFVARIAAAQQKGYDIESLKSRVRVVANKFLLVILEPDLLRENYGLGQNKYYDAVINELRAQNGELESEYIDGKWPLTPDEEALENREKSPTWCKDETRRSVNANEVYDLIHNTRYIHGIVADFFLFTGNIQGAISVLQKRLDNREFDDDINANAGLAEALYLGERTFGPMDSSEKAEEEKINEISKRFEKALAAVEAQAKIAKECVVVDDQYTKDNKEICQKLGERYHRAQLNIKRDLAFMWAQERMRWPTVIAYAEENYKALWDNRPKQFPCMDNFMTVDIMDTYAYAKLARQAYNLQTFRIQLNITEVREMRSILEDAKAQLRRTDGDICFGNTERRILWGKRVSSHLKLAEAMLQ